MTAMLEANIGPYRTIRQIGAGGMGEVFLAHDVELGRDIAIKLLPSHLASDSDHLSRLRHEARSASSLNHPNIVTIYEIGHLEGNAFIAMEYIDGVTLRDLMNAGPIPIRKALQLSAQVADGLAAAHKRGLIHRDLKPENVMITTDGVVKILDFGVAKTTIASDADSHRSTDPGTIVGTYAYMSPEQARAVAVDYRSDQFSLGSVLYEMLCGKPAFAGASGVETLFMVVRDEPSSLLVEAPHIPAPLRWIVERCLAKDPEERYVSTRDLARDLQYLRDHFSEAGVVSPVHEVAVPERRNGHAALIAAGLVGSLILGYLLAHWTSRPVPRLITSEHYLTYSGSDYSPAVSPDGKLIAFSSRRDGTQRIWLKQLNGGSEVALTAGSDDFPRFSSDGTSILYVHQETPGVNGLYLIPVVGGEARRIVDVAGSGDFSPDGTRIAFTRTAVARNGTSESQLLVASADGSNVHQILSSPIHLLGQPRWSPDQSSIALVGSRGRPTQTVVVVDVASGKARVLSSPQNAGQVSTPIWSRDGKSLFYLRAESVEAVVGGSARIIRHDVASDRADVIGWSSHNATILDLLADGRLVLDVSSPRDNLRETALSPGGNDRWLTRGNSSDRQPVYSPDGKSVLFSSNRSGNLDLWLLSIEGGSVRKITDDAAEDWDPAFSPDGRKIIWSSGRSGNLEIWIANADGSEARQVTHDNVDAENPSATADGQWIVYTSFRPDKPGIWKVHPDGTGATVLVPGRASTSEVSPDGAYASYISGDPPHAGIRVVRIADGKDTGFFVQNNVVRRTAAILGRTRWMPDGKRIAFLGQNADGVNGVLVQDFVPGRDTSATRRELGGFDRETATESFGISRDGKSMMVAGWEQLFSLFSIDGLPSIRTRTTDRKGN